MKRRGRILVFVMIGFVALAGAVGCNKRSTPQDAQPVQVAEPDVEHTVRYSGETLAVIAKWYTGKATNWNAIRDANPGLRPERINLGQVIMIPRALVVEERPMPKDFVKSVSAAKAAKESEAAPSMAPTGMEGSASSEPVAVTPPTDTAPVDTAPTGTAQVEPTHTEPVVDTPPASSSSAASVADDKEREKLLDELLQQ